MTVNQDDVTKALEALKAVGSAETLSKGHAQGDRVNIEVDSMSSETGDHQVHHTASNSDVGTWAGTSQTPCPENGTVDGIDGNGTDYNRAAGLAKACAVKLATGEALSTVEAAFVDAGGLSKAYDFGKDDKDDDKAEKAMDDKDDDKDMNKSLVEIAREDEEMNKGFEVSDYLGAQVDVLSKALDCVEARIVDRVAGMLASQTESSQEFNVGLSKALVRMAESQAAQGQRIDQVETAPARGPLSTQNVQAVQKSFGNGGPAQEQAVEPALIKGALEQLMITQKVKPLDVIKYDSTGEISPANMQMVKSLVNGAGQ